MSSAARAPAQSDQSSAAKVTGSAPGLLWLKSVAPEDSTLQEIFASVWPFIALQIIGLVVVMFFPQIALWLPAMLHGWGRAAPGGGGLRAWSDVDLVA